MNNLIKEKPILEPLHPCDSKEHWPNMIVDGKCWMCEKVGEHREYGRTYTAITAEVAAKPF